jgi:CRISPR/Cas system-associated endoribonuclease Cas2
VAKLIDNQTDSVRFYRLCADCAGRMEIQGWGTRIEDPEVYIL